MFVCNFIIQIQDTAHRKTTGDRISRRQPGDAGIQIKVYRVTITTKAVSPHSVRVAVGIVTALAAANQGIALCSTILRTLPVVA